MMRIGTGLGLTVALRNSGAFTPAALQNMRAWYDPSDLSTLFQDVAMTVPVTGDGQPVGAMRDKSGNGYHMLQPVAPKRPIYRRAFELHWLEFDGVGDCMSTSGFSMVGADEVTIAMAVFAQDSGTIGTLCELSANSGNSSGTFALFERGVDAAQVSWRSRGDAYTATHNRVRSVALPATSIYTCAGKIASDLNTIRRNGGLLGATSITDQGGGVFATDALFLGARGGSIYAFRGRLYGLCLFNRVLPVAEVVKLETFLADKSEVVL
jgi:hypothetical protein